MTRILGRVLASTALATALSFSAMPALADAPASSDPMQIDPAKMDWGKSGIQTQWQDPAAKAGGGLHLSADGRFLYVSNRGTANQIVVFAIGKQDGQLSLLQRRSVEGDHPREFAIDPSGKYLLVANQKSNQIVVMHRDPRTGQLGETLQKFDQPAPSDLKFLD